MNIIVFYVKEIMKKHEIYHVLLVLLAIFVFFSYGISAAYRGIGLDQYYYAGCTRLILEGKIPYVDFASSYPPLVYYIMVLPLSLYHDSVAVHLISNYCFSIIDAFLLFVLLKKHVGKTTSVWGGLLFLLLLLLFEAFWFELEPFVLFFGLLSLIVIQSEKSYRYYLAGVLCFLSFMCKQYGLGFIFLCCLYTILSLKIKEQKYMPVFKLLASFVICLLSALGVLFLCGGSLDNILVLSGGGYSKWGIKGFVSGFQQLIHIVPVFFPALFIFVYFIKKAIKNTFLVVNFVGVLGFLLQLFVRPYAHYLILVCPFLVIFLFSLLNFSNSLKYKSIIYLLLAYTTFNCVREVRLMNNANIKINERYDNSVVASKIRDYIPYGTKNVFVSLLALQYAAENDYRPTNIEKHGMTNGFVESPEKIKMYLNNSDYCVITEHDLSRKALFTEENLDILKSCYKKNAIVVDELRGQTYIYKRNK